MRYAATCVLAVGVLTGVPGTYALPLRVADGRITVAETYAPDPALGQDDTVGPEAPLRSEVVFVTYHDRDYFVPLARYTRLLEVVLARAIQNVATTDFGRQPYWRTWGLDPTGSGSFTKADVRRIAQDLKTR
ncbi:MAG: hypothetical protein HY906_20850 [Deltaproteobacteria bacterium]|nr:hypothetical protein [Deltaproteobacteria bacterium]